MSQDFFALSRETLAQLLHRGSALPPYRAAQVFDWVYRQGQEDFQQMSNLKRELRASLAEMFCFPRAKLIERRQSEDGSQKLLLEVSPGRQAETVLIQQPDRVTLCLSSQYGCAMGCRFCRTAAMAWQGQLSTGDMIRQVLAAAETADGSRPPFDNVVFMGMGEPLHNLKAVLEACRILLDDHAFKIGPRKITVSTVGLVPRIRELAAARLGINLAVSLNATTDKVRSQIMPINRRFALETLLQALREFPLGPRRRITIEYVLIAGVNDSSADLRRLPKLLEGIKSKINLIPCNAIPGGPYQAPSSELINTWHRTLIGHGLPTTIRFSKGNDILAACGQLAAPLKALGGTTHQL